MAAVRIMLLVCTLIAPLFIQWTAQPSHAPDDCTPAAEVKPTEPCCCCGDDGSECSCCVSDQPAPAPRPACVCCLDEAPDSPTPEPQSTSLSLSLKNTLRLVLIASICTISDQVLTTDQPCFHFNDAAPKRSYASVQSWLCVRTT